MRPTIPEKLFFKIGEVARIADVEAYTLRYWETEFPFLHPRKSTTGQRVYTREDLGLVITIRDLLYHEGYTLEGVRKRLAPGRRQAAKGTGTGVKETQEQPASQTLQRVKKELADLAELMDRNTR